MFYLTKLLVKLFVKDSDNCDNPKVRTAYGNLSGVCGIILNLLLFGGKLFAGIVSASVSVIATPSTTFRTQAVRLLHSSDLSLQAVLPTESIRSVTAVMSMWQAWEFPL